MVMKNRKQAVMEAREYKSRRRKYKKEKDEELNWRLEIVRINEAFQVIQDKNPINGLLENNTE